MLIFVLNSENSGLTLYSVLEVLKNVSIYNRRY